jgi:multiple sugar transport system ATP-binding protein
MANLTFGSVGKSFPDGTRAVNELSFSVADGEFVVLVGPSGCGKTTALRMVAGLEEITDGEILIGDDVINFLAPRERDVAMVFQNYALYPQMRVADNIGFGLKMRGVPKERIRERVIEIARMLDLEPLLDRKPANLSGGQRQRVAMGRAIAREPRLFLMDEPLSNLDAKLRVQMRAEISRLQLEVGVTTLYVTHDQVEAMTMGSRIAVMRGGELQQYGAPQELYEHPENLFVATFLGSPAMNLLEARLDREGSGLVARLGAQDLALPDELLRRRPSLADYAGRTIGIGLRPEHLQVAGANGNRGTTIPGAVTVVELLGPEIFAHIEVQATAVDSDLVREGAAVDPDEAVAGLNLHGATTLVGRFPPETNVRPGDRVDLAVDLSHLHVFDLETGAALP